MRLLSILRKNIREQKRDLWVLALSMAFAPLFVFLYYLFTGGTGSTAYSILVLNQDIPAALADGSILSAGEEVIAAMQTFSYENGSPLLKVKMVDSLQQAQEHLRNRAAVLLVTIPADFSSVLAAVQSGDASARGEMVFLGDMTNPYYTIGAVMAYTAIDQVILQWSGEQRPIELVENALGGSAARSEFEMYVPGLLIFAVIIMVFQAAMTVAREIEGGKLKRLQLSRMNAFDLLGGTSIWLILVATAELLLTFATALACGFRSQGQLWIAILIGIVTSFSIIGAGMIVACFSKNVSQAFVIANFPLGFFMCLSGAIFPLPRHEVFTFLGHSISLYDLLPPTHAVNALNKVFTLGAGLADVSFELLALALLSALYFGAGVWLFQRMHLRRG